MAIHYTKTNWLNNEQPAINQSNLNKIEQGIYDATEALNDRVQTVNNQSPDANGNVELQTLPSGGTAGQTIIKQSATEGDAIWADLNATGIELTQVEYDALSEAEKNNGSLYFITDGVSSPSANTIPASGVTYGSGSVADALDGLSDSINGVKLRSLPSVSATARSFSFQNNNERHILFVVDSNSARCGVYVVGTNASKVAFYTVLVAASGITVTVSSNVVTFTLASSGSPKYIDLIAAGSVLEDA